MAKVESTFHVSFYSMSIYVMKHKMIVVVMVRNACLTKNMTKTSCDL